MANFDGSQKTLTHVGRSRNPIRKVHLHNTKSLQTKSTRAAAGLWKLELMCGPLKSRLDGMTVKNLWKRSRGVKSRRQRGISLALEWGLKCWDTRYNEKSPSPPPGRDEELPLVRCRKRSRDAVSQKLTGGGSSSSSPGSRRTEERCLKRPRITGPASKAQA